MVDEWGRTYLSACKDGFVLAYLSAELRPCFDELCGVGHESGILDVIGDPIEDRSVVMDHLRFDCPCC